jgi:uncharacterized protein (DUF983 family)
MASKRIGHCLDCGGPFRTREWGKVRCDICERNYERAHRGEVPTRELVFVIVGLVVMALAFVWAYASL